MLRLSPTTATTATLLSTATGLPTPATTDTPMPLDTTMARGLLMLSPLLMLMPTLATTATLLWLLSHICPPSTEVPFTDSPMAVFTATTLARGPLMLSPLLP